MAHSSTISSKGQITLPKELRDRHHLREGELIIVLDSPDGLLIRHGRPKLRGMLRGRIDSEAFQKEVRSIRKEWRL